MAPSDAPDDEPLHGQLAQLRVLYALAETLIASSDTGQVCEAALDGFRAALDAERVAILTSDAEGVLRCVAWRGLSPRYRQALEGLAFWRADTAGAAPVVVADAAADPAVAHLRHAAPDEGVCSLLAVPLVVAGRTIGMCVLCFDAPRTLRLDETRLAQTIGDHVAFAVERAAARDELHRSEARFRALVQHSSDITTVLDADGTIRYESPSCERLLGWREADIVGRNAFELVHPDDRKTTAAAFGEAIRRGETTHPVEFRFRRADGRYATLEAVGVNRLDAPPLHGIVVNSRDVTERNRMAEELRQAHKMEAIGRLAGGIAHDFNNLLTVIGGYADAALADPDPAEVTRCLEEVRKATERAAALTAQLLAFARRRVITPTAVDLNDSLLALGDMLQRLIGSDVRLETVLAPDAGCIRVDRGQLEQVVMNLAINARDAMPDGGVLRLETSFDAASRTVCLTVTDTGCGMDRETMARVFEPFFTTKGPGQGTGLGLATVYGIVTQHGGTIAVESMPARGSTFRLTFAAEAAAGPDGRAASPEAALATGSETILLVEDESMVRNLVRTMLSSRGYAVLEAASGEDALERYGSAMESIDLLLTDVVMPGINGRVLAERLTARRPDLKVLFMSGYTEDAVLGARAREGRFLQKPFAPGALRAAVRQVLDAPAAPVV